MTRYYPLSWLVFLAIVILSVMPVPETPLNEVRYIDKWTHLVMYFGQSSVIWFEYLRQHGLRFGPKPHGLRREELSRGWLLFYALLLPIALGCTMELVQAYCTHGMRSGDPVDAVANAIGAVLANVVIGLGVRTLPPPSR